MKNRIEGHPNLFKDSESGFIISRDDGERQKYRNAKHTAVDQLQQKHEISKLKEELSDIKSLLHQILNK